MKDENNILNEIDIFISYHLIYMNKLRKALSGNIDPELTDCHSCQFGKKFNELKGGINPLPTKVKNILNEIDTIHCDFHSISYSVFKDKVNQEKFEQLNKMSDLLIRKLLRLKMIIKNPN
ncbi:CZB domain-containing protein [Persephonella sp.]|uniref:CZB domain-containing protein n=1 Tax=Persephonella sp. TaxID=2060922 RepID=UPI0025CBA25A|nr:CZB domain-containing protein [Persephonella sp.]